MHYHATNVRFHGDSGLKFCYFDSALLMGGSHFSGGSPRPNVKDRTFSVNSNQLGFYGWGIYFRKF